MRKGIINLDSIKDKILAVKGKDINIIINKGRKRISRYSGVVEDLYPSVFTVKILNDRQLKSVTCSYSDVLCGDVKINEK